MDDEVLSVRPTDGSSYVNVTTHIYKSEII